MHISLLSIDTQKTNSQKVFNLATLYLKCVLVILTGSGLHSRDRELERQNRITQQILQNYLERRLFPHRQAHAPSPSEILPPLKRPNDSIQEKLGPKSDAETLQSVESEHISAVYEDDEEFEGMIIVFIQSVFRPRNTNSLHESLLQAKPKTSTNFFSLVLLLNEEWPFEDSNSETISCL